jgi:1-phosphatidylinositol-4-phosphate 5-kinase
MQGQGKYCWPTGQTYEGEFVNNLKHGSGMWIDNEGNSYLGEWKLGEAFGFGVYT